MITPLFPKNWDFLTWIWKEDESLRVQATLTNWLLTVLFVKSIVSGITVIKFALVDLEVEACPFEVIALCPSRVGTALKGSLVHCWENILDPIKLIGLGLTCVFRLFLGERNFKISLIVSAWRVEWVQLTRFSFYCMWHQYYGTKQQIASIVLSCPVFDNLCKI